MFNICLELRRTFMCMAALQSALQLLPVFLELLYLDLQLLTLPPPLLLLLLQLLLYRTEAKTSETRSILNFQIKQVVM